MAKLSLKAALAKLTAEEPITFDDLDEIFRAFGFSSELKFQGPVWYWHDRYRNCGLFRAEPRYEFSILSDEQRVIVARIIQCVRQRQALEA